ncbi:MAG: Hsp20/alpha crystallin family protein [Planctomycetaceae bacterium]
MPVFRWGENWNPFRDLEREVEGLLQSVNLSVNGIRLGRQYPAINLYELTDEYLLTAEIPGTKAEDLDLTIAGSILTIKGKRTDPEGIPDDRFRRQERFRGAWQRSISLPERVKEEELTAEFTHGVLRIHLPKAADGKPRQIFVTDGES